MPTENQTLIHLTERIRQTWSRDYRMNYERGERYLRDWSSTTDLRGEEFFAVTLTPQAKVIFAKGIWTNLDARERYVMGLWKNLKHQLNRKLHNNYQRYPQYQLVDLAVVENFPSNPNQNETFCNPHLHGVIAVPKERCDRLYEVLTRSSSNQYQLNLDDLSRAENGIHDVLVEPLRGRDNLCGWLGYVTKQQEGNQYEYQQERRIKQYQSI